MSCGGFDDHPPLIKPGEIVLSAEQQRRVAADLFAFSFVDEAAQRVAAAWRERIINRLAEKLDKELRADGPAPLPTTEQQALSMLKSVAQELLEAAAALEASAKQLKDDGKGFRAGHAKQAANRARSYAQNLIGG